jgi:hypothetical protein
MNINLKIYPNKFSAITYNTELFQTSLISADDHAAVIKLFAKSDDPFLSPGMKGSLMLDNNEKKITITGISKENGWTILNCRLQRRSHVNS